MQRITITIDDGLLGIVDALSLRRGYPSRSEAIRDLLRAATDGPAAPAGSAPCIATLSYVRDPAARRPAERQGAHPGLGIAGMHVQVDRKTCLEVTVLRGEAGAVRRFAETVASARGVRHHALHVVPLQAASGLPGEGGEALPDGRMRA